jgi:FGGY family of carbohydrate kinases, N-terminal domain
MRQLLLGIDSGTQSTKAVVVDAHDGKVVGTGAQTYELIAKLPPGAKEQHPHTWRDAAGTAIRQALREAKARSGEVIALGVSGQQHAKSSGPPNSGMTPRPSRNARTSRPRWAVSNPPSARSATRFCPVTPLQKFSG